MTYAHLNLFKKDNVCLAIGQLFDDNAEQWKNYFPLTNCLAAIT